MKAAPRFERPLGATDGSWLYDLESQAERSIRLTLTSAPSSQAVVRVNELFRIGALVRAKNVSLTAVRIILDDAPVQLVDSPQEVVFGAGSYDEEVEWLVRAVRPTSKAAYLRLRAEADGLFQVAQIPIRIAAQE